MKLKQYAVIAFFALFLLYGMLVVKDYGTSTDERVERTSSLVTYQYVMPGVSNVVTETVDFTEIEALETYRDRYYGVAVQLPLVFIEHLFHFQLSYGSIYLLRHGYNFLVFFAACIYFFLLCKRLSGDCLQALFGAAMLIFSPRILAEAFYNIKDLQALSWTVITLYYGFRFLEKPEWKRGIPLAAAGAVLTNVRIVGAEVIAVTLLFAFFIRKVERRQKVKAVVLTAVLCLGAYVLITPVLWRNPIEGILGILRQFSDYTAWDGNNYYLGQVLSAGETPWHYLFVWIGMTTPVLYLLLAAAGSIFQIKDRQGYLLTLILIPVFYVLLRHPVLYNGWRHFYFIYPMILLLAFIGWQKLWEVLPGLRARRCAALAVLLYLVSIGGWIARNHPNEYVYFNLPSRAYAAENMEKDYWAESERQALQYILKTDDRENIAVLFPFTTGNSLETLPDKDKRRITAADLGRPDLADYYIDMYSATCPFDFEGQEDFAEYYSIEVDGMKINTIYRRCR